MTSQPRADRGNKRVAGSRARRYLAAGLVAGGVWFAVLSTGPAPKPDRRADGARSGPRRRDRRLRPRTADRHGVHRPQRHLRPGKGVRQGAAGHQRRGAGHAGAGSRRQLRTPNGACSGSRFTRASPAIPACIYFGRRARRWMPPARRIDTADLREHAAPRQSRRQLPLERHGAEVRAEPDSTARVSGRRRPAAPREPQRRHHPVRGEPRRRSRRSDGDRDHGDRSRRLHVDPQ